MNKANGFPKSQRLCSQYLTEKLFTPGCNKSFSAYPLRLVFRIEANGQENMPNSLLISVPKRCFKHAVDRNRAKRQIREAYRTNRNLLRLPEGKHALLAIIWLDSHHHPSSVVTAKVRNLLQRTSESLIPRSGER